MKKFIVLMLSIVLCSFAFASNFRDSSWGDSIQEVKGLEKGVKFKQDKTTEKKVYFDKKYEWEKTLYSFTEKVKFLGDFDITYVFLKDKLISGKYSQKIEDKNLDKFNRMKELLNDKYGSYTQVSESSSYKLINGKKEASYRKIYSWHPEDTRVNLVLIDDDKFEVEYLCRNQEMLDFIENVGLEKQKQAKEKIKSENKEILEKF